MCDVTFTATSGTISSPNYPNNYPTNQNCVWLVNVGLGYKVTLSFEAFEMEVDNNCEFDYLQVNESTLNKIIERYAL